MTRAAVSVETKATGDVCLDDKKMLALSTMKPPFMPVPELGGVVYLRAATSKLPWKAKMATLIPKIDVHLGNVG